MQRLLYEIIIALPFRHCRRVHDNDHSSKLLWAHLKSFSAFFYCSFTATISTPQLDSIFALHWTTANNVSNVTLSIFLIDIVYRQVMKLSYSSAWKWFWVVVQNTSWNSVKRMPENIIFWYILYTDFLTYQFSRFNSLTLSSMLIAKEVWLRPLLLVSTR